MGESYLVPNVQERAAARRDGLQREAGAMQRQNHAALFLCRISLASVGFLRTWGDYGTLQPFWSLQARMEVAWGAWSTPNWKTSKI